MTMTEKNKEDILIVLPYGMCFRNIVFNETLWSYLRNKFNIDILSPIEVQNKEALGIRYVFRSSPKTIIARLVRSINSRIIRFLKYIDLAHFLLAADLGENLSVKYRWALSDKDRRDMLLYGAFRYFRISEFVRRIFRGIPFFHPHASIFNRRRYKYVIVTHIAEAGCIITALLI